MAVDVMFVIPAFGRPKVSAVCFSALAWTIEQLAEAGIAAGAVVIADDENLDLAAAAGLETIDRPNERGEKLNDGFEHAHRADAEFAVYLGSDDLICPAHVHAQIDAHRALGGRRGEFTVIASRTSSIVSHDGRRIAHLKIPQRCGDGVSLRPTRLLARLRHRPIPVGVNRAMDGAIWTALRRSGRLHFEYVDAAPCQITDLKTREVQVTTYRSIANAGYIDRESSDPWGELAAVYPERVVQAAAAVYGRAAMRAAERVAA